MSPCPAEYRASQENLSDRAAELLRWLGVPAFADRTAIWKYGRITPLIWMIAFQLGVLAESGTVSAGSMLAAAPVVALLAFLTLPISASIIRTRCSWHRWLLLPLALAPAAAFSWAHDAILPHSWSASVFSPHCWRDAAITLVVLYTAMIIL